MAIVIGIGAVLLVVVVVVAVVLSRRRSSVPPPPTVSVDAELLRRAETLPPSPERTIVRLRVELAESLAAAGAAVEVLADDTERFFDLGGTLARLRRVGAELDGRLDRSARTPPAAAAELVPPLRTQVREVQGACDRLVELSSRALGGPAPELRSLHEGLDAELAVLDAHDDLDGR